MSGDAQDVEALLERLDAQASWFSLSFEKNRPDDVGTARRPYEIDTEIGRNGQAGLAFVVQGETLREAVQALADQIERAAP